MSGASRRAAARLVFRDAQGREGTLQLGTETIYIGRGTDCAIRTDDAMVSRRHSILRRVGDAWQIEDLGSSNGTLVNESSVKTRLLEHNDIVRCGSLWMRFVDDASAGSGSSIASDPSLPTTYPQVRALDMDEVGRAATAAADASTVSGFIADAKAAPPTPPSSGRTLPPPSVLTTGGSMAAMAAPVRPVGPSTEQDLEAQNQALAFRVRELGRTIQQLEFENAELRKVLGHLRNVIDRTLVKDP